MTTLHVRSFKAMTQVFQILIACQYSNKLNYKIYHSKIVDYFLSILA